MAAERQFIENRVQKIIDLKKKICDGTDKGFVVVNQKVVLRWLAVDVIVHNPFSRLTWVSLVLSSYETFIL